MKTRKAREIAEFHARTVERINGLPTDGLDFGENQLRTDDREELRLPERIGLGCYRTHTARYDD